MTLTSNPQLNVAHCGEICEPSSSMVAGCHALSGVISLAENFRMSSSNGWNKNLTEDESVAKLLNQRKNREFTGNV
jgi:hypothetical protein